MLTIVFEVRLVEKEEEEEGKHRSPKTWLVLQRGLFGIVHVYIYIQVRTYFKEVKRVPPL